MIPRVPQRNAVSGEDVCWYKEEFKLLISFKIYHCPNFQIALKKSAVPHVVSCGGSETTLLDPQLF